MINLIGHVKYVTGVAVSGGPDSMAALSFIGRHSTITAYYFDHKTEHGTEAKEFIKDYCNQNKLNLICGEIKTTKPSDLSWEEFWRLERYKFLNSFEQIIATAHHLDDAVETYIFGCAHGREKFISYEFRNVVRPFLLTPKQELINWCLRHSIPYLQDPSNENTDYTRNQIRLNVLPALLKVNPGLHTVVKKKYQQLYTDQRGLE